ncbi:MAG: HindIII family type II restriction endonuclease [Nitrospirota bacterium]
MKVITKAAIQRREYWIEEIRKISGNFGDNSERIENELSEEIKKEGASALIDHLRLSGNGKFKSSIITFALHLRNAIEKRLRLNTPSDWHLPAADFYCSTHPLFPLHKNT